MGNTLGVVTISGGAGVLISDAAEAEGLAMPPMPAAAQARLRGLVPFSNPANPVDCTAQAFNDMSLIGAFGRAMVEEGGYSSVIAFFTQVGASPSIAPRLRSELNAVKDAHPDRLWVLSVLAPPERVAEYEADGFLVFEDPSRAVVALAAQGRFGAAFARRRARRGAAARGDAARARAGRGGGQGAAGRGRRARRAGGGRPHRGRGGGGRAGASAFRW